LLQTEALAIEAALKVAADDLRDAGGAEVMEEYDEAGRLPATWRVGFWLADATVQLDAPLAAQVADYFDELARSVRARLSAAGLLRGSVIGSDPDTGAPVRAGGAR
jgi:hypothetical protein